MVPFRRRRDEIPAGALTPAEGVQILPKMLPAELPSGFEIGGYRVGEVIGRGGMGVVYRAVHVHLGREVALKLLPPELGLQADFRERFIRESQIAASLEHPNIVGVFDAGEALGALFIALQIVRGSDMRHLLDERGRLEPAELVPIVQQVASALDAAHEAGLVHRDVKPANILIDGDHCWLTDFGLTKRLSSASASLTARHDIVGTLDYLAPEQIEGTALDGRTDQYALGCVIHHALTGEPPFERDSDVAVMQAHLNEPPERLSHLRPDLPPELDMVVGRALAKEREDRFPYAADLAAALRAALGVGGAAAVDAPPAPGVLVGVEDPATRALIQAALRKGRLEVAIAANAYELVARAAEHRPALVLVDVALPGLELADLCRELRAMDGSEHIPVVALAERGYDDQWRAALQAGADDVLLRPFSAFQLHAKLRDHVPEALDR